MGFKLDLIFYTELRYFWPCRRKWSLFWEEVLALDRGRSLPSTSEGKACFLPACSPCLSTFSAGPCVETPPGFQQRGAMQERGAGRVSVKCRGCQKPVPRSSTELSQVPEFPKFTVYLWIKAVLAQTSGMSSALPRPGLATAPLQIPNGWGWLHGGGGILVGSYAKWNNRTRVQLPAVL